MRQLRVKILIFGMLLCVFSGCSTSRVSSEDGLKQGVWKQLSEQQKGEVIGDWKSAKVDKVVLHENMMGGIKDKSYLNQEVYLISFKTKNSAVLGDLGVYVEKEHNRILGARLRD